MIEITCKCGSSKKNFSIDIGPFYIDVCCEKAGFDYLGNKVEVKKVEEKKFVEVAVKVMEEHKEVFQALAKSEESDKKEDKKSKKKR